MCVSGGGGALFSRQFCLLLFSNHCKKATIQMVPNLVNLVDIQPNGLDVRELDIVACEQRLHRSTCAYAQFDKRMWWWRIPISKLASYII